MLSWNGQALETSAAGCLSIRREGKVIVYVVMGIAGSGKSTVGRLLADKLRLPFHDGDDYHSRSDIAKMRRGIPLTDADRGPWLRAIAGGITAWNQAEGAVLACSALKEEYRRVLTKDGAEDVVFIHLQGPPELIKSRIEHRSGHYFPPALVDSQLDILEPPAGAISVDVSSTPEVICRRILQELSDRKILASCK